MNSRTLVRALWREANALLRLVWQRLPLRRQTVLYESFAGNGALCNPEALFRQLLRERDLAGLRHVWVMAPGADFSAIRAEFRRARRVRFVRRGGPTYFRLLATSRYLINNATFPPAFTKRRGQVYVNTWHGTPLKRMGYDMPTDGAIEAANTIRNFLSADYLLSQNAFMTQQMYATGYRLRGIFAGRVLEGSYPRMDRQRNGSAQRSEAIGLLERAGIRIDGRKVVLYAPTWRGSRFDSPTDDTRLIVDSALRLQELLDPERYVVLLRSHQVVADRLNSQPQWRSFVVPNSVPTNLLLGVTDALVTDFSSILFDYLPQPGPIAIFAQDPEQYLSTRGTYFGLNELPGVVCDDIEAIVRVVEGTTPVKAELARRRDEWRARFTASSDGNDSRRVIDVVFRGLPHANATIDLADDPRTSVLLHMGSLNSNGITSSALNLLRALDPKVVDVSVVFADPTGRSQAVANQQQIPGYVRQFIRPLDADSHVIRMLRRAQFFLAQAPKRSRSARANRHWDTHWRSLFGSANFHSVVDFDGYGPFWANLLLSGTSDNRSIWLHNEMSLEQHRIVGGRHRLRRSLGAVFALYPQFDSLVSVSPALTSLNRETLGARLGIPETAFLTARNVIDGDRVLAQAAESDSMVSNPAALDPKFRGFVTIGRLSPEKNQRRLIAAFALVHESHPNARLLLIGDGPLRQTLVAQIDSLGLRDFAMLAGFVANPFPLLAQAECFVLSSDYEGQPMVLLEAAILGRPIVSTNFATVHDALPAGSIRVVERSVEALAAGMLEFLDGLVAPAFLDVGGYNKRAVDEFLAVLDADVRPLTRVLIAGSDGIAHDAVGPIGSRREGMEIVGGAVSSVELHAQIAAQQPRVVVLGSAFEDCNGLELSRDLRRELPTLPIVVLLGYPSSKGTYPAMVTGQGGFTIVDPARSEVFDLLRQVIGSRPTPT